MHEKIFKNIPNNIQKQLTECKNKNIIPLQFRKNFSNGENRYEKIYGTCLGNPRSMHHFWLRFLR